MADEDAIIKATWALVSRHGISYAVATALLWLYGRPTAGWMPIVEAAGGYRRGFNSTVRPMLTRGLVLECRVTRREDGRWPLPRYRVNPSARAEIRELLG